MTPSKIDLITLAALVVVGTAWFLDHQHQRKDWRDIHRQLDHVMEEHASLLRWVGDHRDEMGAKLSRLEELEDGCIQVR